jgi:hypothetical protein
MSADDDKRAAQTAFMDAENIKELYQQIVSKGHILMGGESITQRITQAIFPEIEPPDIQREIGLEPER